jgi:hypothetical protein
MSDQRTLLAEELLQEAVYRSRAEQAAQVGLSKSAGAKTGNCGLGAKAAVALDLSPRGEQVFASLFARELSESELAGVRDVMRAWIERQDQLDRDRNHFLKAFRAKHGFDRSRYAPDELAAFEAGLAEVNQKADRERREHAERLLATAAKD